MSCTWPSIDHSILSPSGHCSKRARKAAQERMRQLLFPEGLTWEKEPTDEKAYFLRKAKEFREWAERGVQPRKMIKAAEEMEAKAAQL